MPIKKSAFKALRQNKKRAVRNQKIREGIAFLIKKSRKQIEAKDFNSAKEFAAKAVRALDKAAQKGIFKKNTTARLKSRLIQRLNKAQK